jgi:2'-5' RNA ligase
MSAVKAPLHLWAIVPPPDLEAEIDRIRKEFSERFQCFKALRPPVHITLYKPFAQAVDNIEAQIDKMRAWISEQPSFVVRLEDFGFFEKRKSPVAFIDVVVSPELVSLNAGITSKTKELFGLEPHVTDQRFHPHFTIGYRDLSPAIFPEAKRVYSNRSLSAVFDVKQVCLFRHNGKNWELQHELPMAESFR